ncbi:unnamed protein product, partial [Prorocentrum cordatum]
DAQRAAEEALEAVRRETQKALEIAQAESARLAEAAQSQAQELADAAQPLAEKAAEAARAQAQELREAAQPVVAEVVAEVQAIGEDIHSGARWLTQQSQELLSEDVAVQARDLAEKTQAQARSLGTSLWSRAQAAWAAAGATATAAAAEVEKAVAEPVGVGPAGGWGGNWESTLGGLLGNLGLEEQAEMLESMPTFPSQESKDYIKQCCADMLARMRDELAIDISKSLTDTIKQNIEVQNKPTIDVLDQLRAQLAQPPADLDQKILSIVRPQLDTTTRRLQAQIDAQQVQINETDGRVSKVEAQLQDVLTQMETLRKELHIAEQRPRAPLTQPKGFDREVDASLVVAMAQRPTTTACVEAELRPWIASLGLADDLYDLVPVGPVPTKKFHIRFKGLIAVASRMAAKVLGALRTDGTWKEFTVEVPGSPRCRIHLGPDKSPRQIRCEILLRRARTIIAERHPNLRLFTDRERATLSIGWDRIMRVEVHPGNKPAEFYWDNQQLAKHDLVKAELVSLLAPLVEPEAAGDRVRSHAVALVPGRVLWVTVVRGPICMEIFNIHNHDLKQKQVKEIVEIILKARAAALRAPSQRLALVVGDFNFAAEDTRSARLQLKSLERRARLWSPLNRRACLTAVTDDSGRSACDPAERVDLLKSYWGPVFSRKPWGRDRAVEHAAKYLPTVDDVVLSPPTPRLLRAVLTRAADSATGCDGLSYTAWRSIPFGATILWDCLEWVMSGQALFDSASTTPQVFLPKNVTEDEAQAGQVARGADKVRVLGLRNCDVKVLSATMNAALRPVLERIAPPCQRGFVPGRNFGLNVLELDVSSRQLSCTPHGSRDLPILYSLDYGQAFPSLNQEFVLFILGALRLPEAVLKFAGFLYEAIEGVAVSMGLRVHLYWVRSGIIQGCALSGSLYAIASSTFLYHLVRVIEEAGRGLARACADDIGGTLKSIEDLAWVALAMREAELVANLVLKIQKCHIVPLSASFSPALASEALGRLTRTVPHWSAMKIVSELLYLGIWLGPSVDSMRPWVDPLAKARLRARAVGRGVTPASLSSIIYNTRIVSTLSYVSQFFWMPRAVLACELGVLAQVFRVALGTFPLSAWVQMDRWRGPRVLSWAHLNAASLLRAAAHTFPEHQRLLDDMRTHACTLADSRPLLVPAPVPNVLFIVLFATWRGCALGCYNCVDSLLHYSRCVRMQAALRRALGHGFPLELAERWGLVAPSTAAFGFLAAAILSPRLDLVDDSMGCVDVLTDAGSLNPDGYPVGADYCGCFSNGGFLLSRCHKSRVLGDSAVSEAMSCLSALRVMDSLPP